MTEKRIIRLSEAPQGFGDTADEIDVSMFDSAPSAQHSYDAYEDEALGLYVGVWDTDDMVEAAGPYACDEFMWLIEGEAGIKNCKTGEMEKAKAGEAFIIPKGYNCQWHQTGYLRKFYFIYEHPQETIPESPIYEGIIIPQMDATSFSLKDNMAPQETVFYKDSTEKFLAGTWQSGSFNLAMSTFPYNEFVYVQSGSVTWTDESRVNHIFKAGDAFFIPEGVMCSARVDKSMAVLFARVLSS